MGNRESHHLEDPGGAVTAATLRACAELGYERVTVEAVQERYPGSRAEFTRHFDGLRRSYAAAYEAEAGRLCAELLRAATEQPTWRLGLLTALDKLARFAVAQPDVARALIVDVHFAGEPAARARAELFERLVAAVDGARDEAEARPAPPDSTALFMVSAVESSLTSALLEQKPERFAAAVPELAQMVTTAYFGEEAAE